MKAEGEIARMAVTYLRCRSIAAPVSLAMFVATGSFRGFKDTKYAASLCMCMVHGHAWIQQDSMAEQISTMQSDGLIIQSGVYVYLLG